MASGSEPIECQALVLRVSIHCEGCKKKVKKVLQNVHGVFRCDVDSRSNKVVVTTSKNLDANILVAKLRKSGKQAEPWPEEPKHQQQQQQQPAESQIQDTKNQNDEPIKTNDQPAENPGRDNAAEPRNPQPSPEPKKITDEAPKPAAQEIQQETANAKAATTTDDANANGNAGDETKVAAGQQSSDPKGKAQQQHQEHKPIDARVTMEYGGGSSYVKNHMPAPPPPVHVVSYNVARPTASAAYYAAPPAPAPPMARPGPSPQGYIDNEYTPSYYSRSSSYEPYYYPQPSPYRYQHYQQSSDQHYQQSSGDDYYYYGATQQRSAFSPPRDAYGDMFNDENANSCSVM